MKKNNTFDVVLSRVNNNKIYNMCMCASVKDVFSSFCCQAQILNDFVCRLLMQKFFAKNGCISGPVNTDMAFWE